MKQPFCGDDTHTAKRLFLCFLCCGFKNCIFISVERRINNHAQHSAGNDFPNPYGQHHKWYRKRNLVPEPQDEWYDKCIG